VKEHDHDPPRIAAGFPERLTSTHGTSFAVAGNMSRRRAGVREVFGAALDFPGSLLQADRGL